MSALSWYVTLCFLLAFLFSLHLIRSEKRKDRAMIGRKAAFLSASGAVLSWSMSPFFDQALPVWEGNFFLEPCLLMIEAVAASFAIYWLLARGGFISLLTVIARSARQTARRVRPDLWRKATPFGQAPVGRSVGRHRTVGSAKQSHVALRLPRPLREAALAEGRGLAMTYELQKLVFFSSALMAWSLWLVEIDVTFSKILEYLFLTALCFSLGVEAFISMEIRLAVTPVPRFFKGEPILAISAGLLTMGLLGLCGLF